MVRSQKTTAWWIVDPMMAVRNWRAVNSTSGNSGTSFLSRCSLHRPRAETESLQKQLIGDFYTPQRSGLRLYYTAFRFNQRAQDGNQPLMKNDRSKRNEKTVLPSHFVRFICCICLLFQVHFLMATLAPNTLSFVCCLL